MSADEQGLWEHYAVGEPLCLPWTEIVAVEASAVASPVAVYRHVALLHESYTTVEFPSDTPGLDEIVGPMCRHLPGLGPDWLDRARAVAPHEGPITLWAR